MASAASPDGLDCRRLIRRLLAHVAAFEGRGMPVAAPPPASKLTPASGHEDGAAASRALLLAVQDMLDRADEKDAPRRRNLVLNWVEDELADEVISQRGNSEATQYDVDVALGQRLEALRIQPTELNVDIDRDAGDAWLHSDQGPLAVVVGALAPQVRLSEKTLWNARAHQGPPLATVGERYVSSRVIRQIALEIAEATRPLPGNVALSDFRRFDASTNERMSEAAWERLRGWVTKPALYSALLKSEGTSDGWAGIRERLESAMQDAKLVIGLATTVLASLWSSAAANVPDPLCQVLGAEMCDRLFETVHARKEEWAVLFLLSQMRAGQLTASQSGFSESQIEELIDHLVTTRVTSRFAQGVDVAFTRAEAAGEV